MLASKSGSNSGGADCTSAEGILPGCSQGCSQSWCIHPINKEEDQATPGLKEIEKGVGSAYGIRTRDLRLERAAS